MAHMPRSSSSLPFLLLLPFLLCLVSFSGCASEDESQADILLKFKSSLENTEGLSSWTKSSGPCNGNLENWVGVLCENGSIWGLKLEKMGLKGSIDVDALRDLPGLRSLSLMGNDFQGSLPDLGQLGALKSLYLSNNKFSGEIDNEIFLKMLSLKKVHLAHNQFSGAIPQSLRFLPKLMELRLEFNDFQGSLPDFLQKTWVSFNVSHNKLNGQIPTSINRMEKSSFEGNELCGRPMKSCASERPSLISMIVVGIVVLVALTAICAVVFILCRRTQYSASPGSSIEAPRPITTHKKINVAGEQNHQVAGIGSSSTSPDRSTNGSTGGGKKAESLKLSFVRDDRQRFDMQDLLRASAEILGSGCFGSSYKAALLSGPVMVVKRFKQMNNVGREEFQEHMRRIGRLRHPNLLPLVAYYYKKEEKLLVADYVHKGSLAVQLHGNQAAALDWTTRMKIIKGVGKGLVYLYTELPSLVSAHGHLKSSNVLLDDNMEPLLTDYGLIPVINQEHAQEVMVAYKSPEYAQSGRITKKTDVWELGMLIIEIVTGRFPARFLQKGKAAEEEDLAAWVKSVPEVDWGDLVFDKQLHSTAAHAHAAQMAEMLKIALACCEADVDKRWDLKEAVSRIDRLSDPDDFYSSRGSDPDLRSMRGLSDDFNFC